jgi:hypothetical protein
MGVFDLWSERNGVVHGIDYADSQKKQRMKVLGQIRALHSRQDENSAFECSKSSSPDLL